MLKLVNQVVINQILRLNDYSFLSQYYFIQAQMQNITIDRLRVLSPVKRARLRTYKTTQLSKPPIISSITISHRAQRFCPTSSSPKRPYHKNKKDYDLCSSGVVLVLAKKLNNKERLLYRQNDPFQKTSEKWRSCKLNQQDLFCQRSQQKYRIRETSRSPANFRSEENFRRLSESMRNTVTSTCCRSTYVPAIDPWNLSGECEQLQDLF